MGIITKKDPIFGRTYKFQNVTGETFRIANAQIQLIFVDTVSINEQFRQTALYGLYLKLNH